MLTIDGVEQLDLARFALRFVNNTDGSARAVLYRDGKRVTKAWALKLDVTTEADQSGGNANTD